MAKPKQGEIKLEDERSPAETERIREATLKKLLSTAPETHQEMVERRRGAKRPTGTQKPKR